MIKFVSTIYPAVDIDPTIMRVQSAWPKGVPVLTTENLSGYTLSDHSIPCTSYDYATLSFRSIELSLAAKALRLWYYRHEKIITHLIAHRQWRGTNAERILVHNTTWASFGYIRNQCKEAITLSNRVMHNPQFRKAGILLHLA